MAKEAYKIRCEDCPNLVRRGNTWTCEECFGQKCIDIDDCPEGVTAEKVEEIQNTAGKMKVDTGATKGKPHEKSDRPKKLNPQKRLRFSLTTTTIQFPLHYTKVRRIPPNKVGFFLYP